MFSLSSSEISKKKVGKNERVLQEKTSQIGTPLLRIREVILTFFDFSATKIRHNSSHNVLCLLLLHVYKILYRYT